jgi:hypothetical protein
LVELARNSLLGVRVARLREWMRSSRLVWLWLRQRGSLGSWLLMILFRRCCLRVILLGIRLLVIGRLVLELRLRLLPIRRLLGVCLRRERLLLGRGLLLVRLSGVRVGRGTGRRSITIFCRSA